MVVIKMEPQNQRNCKSCNGNNKHYEPTWCHPVYCVTQVKHITRHDVFKKQKEGCNLWRNE
jgi:hypothetical protein